MDDTPSAPFDRLGYVEHTLAALVARVARLEQAGRLSPAAPVGVATPPYAPPAPPAPPAPDDAPPSTTPSLETTLGTYWLSRLGILSLITGTALLILTYFGELGAPLRVGLGYAIAAALGGGGLRLARRHATFGRVVFAGGLAIAYFVTYALRFVPAMRILDSEVAGVALVAVAIAGIVAVAHRMRSETVAGVALFLGLHTGLLSEVTTLSLACATLLAVGAAFFLVANRWVIVPFSTVVAVYLTHATLALGLGLSGGAAPLAPGLALLMLAIDFALFAGAALLRPDLPAAAQTALAALNWACVLMLGAHALEGEPAATLCAALVGFAAVHAALAGAAQLRGAPRDVIALHLALAHVTVALALPVELRGAALVAAWLALALGMVAIGRRAAWPSYFGLALALIGLAYGAARVGHLGAPGALAAVLALAVMERVHAPGRAEGPLRNLLVVGVVLGLMHVAELAAPGGWLTLAWLGVAVTAFAAGFALRLGAYRWAGFGVLGIAASRFLVVQARALPREQQILTFVLAGVALLVVSFVYTRMRHRGGGPPAA